MGDTQRRVGVLGATGLVGRALCARLVAEGREVVAFSRRVEGAGRIPGVIPRANDALEGDGVEDLDAVVNLVGEPVMGSRWSPEVKRRILASRVETTKQVVDAIARAGESVRVLVNASAVGFYGPRGAEVVREGDAAGGDFLAEVCVAWEREAVRAEAHGARVVRARIGIVLAKGGGALAEMVTPFKLFGGGHLGDGRQFMPWVHIDDVVGAIAFALDHPGLRGAVNVTAPEPLCAKDFARALGRAMGRPAWLPVPAFALRAALGEAAGAILAGQRAVPEALLREGYRFRWTSLDDALRDALSG